MDVNPVFAAEPLPADLLLLKDGEIVSRQRVAEDAAVASDPVAGVFVTYEVPRVLSKPLGFNQPLRLRELSGGFSEEIGSLNPLNGGGGLFDRHSRLALIPRQGRQ